MSAPKPRVVLHTDEHFVTAVLIDSDAVDVFEICEATPADRVYRYSRIVDRSVIDALIGDSAIGHIDDDSPAQRRTEAAVNGGRPALTLVKE